MASMTVQAEEYLEAICRIHDRGGVATPTELGHELGVAPPSALGMLRRLDGQGLVSYSRRGGAELTAEGQRRADSIRRRHRLAECLLTDLLGMPWSRAHEIACRFEHVIDDELEPYLLAALNNPTTCPHGNPLTGVDDRFSPLLELPVGEYCLVRRLVDESEPALEYLARMGIRPGARVLLCAAAPFDGPLTVSVEGERHALAMNMAQSVLVERVEGEKE